MSPNRNWGALHLRRALKQVQAAAVSAMDSRAEMQERESFSGPARSPECLQGLPRALCRMPPSSWACSRAAPAQHPVRRQTAVMIAWQLGRRHLTSSLMIPVLCTTLSLTMPRQRM